MLTGYEHDTPCLLTKLRTKTKIWRNEYETQHFSKLKLSRKSRSIYLNIQSSLLTQSYKHILQRSLYKNVKTNFVANCCMQLSRKTMKKTLGKLNIGHVNNIKLYHYTKMWLCVNVLISMPNFYKNYNFWLINKMETVLMGPWQKKIFYLNFLFRLLPFEFDAERSWIGYSYSD